MPPYESTCSRILLVVFIAISLSATVAKGVATANDKEERSTSKTNTARTLTRADISIFSPFIQPDDLSTITSGGRSAFLKKFKKLESQNPDTILLGYHGTRTNLEKMELLPSLSKNRNSDSCDGNVKGLECLYNLQIGSGFYFTNKYDVALDYARLRAKQRNLKESYVCMITTTRRTFEKLSFLEIPENIVQQQMSARNDKIEPYKKNRIDEYTNDKSHRAIRPENVVAYSLFNSGSYQYAIPESIVREFKASCVKVQCGVRGCAIM